MFEGFAHVWTPALLSRQLGSKPVPVTVAGEKVAFFRDAQGRARALVDRCPHRGVALSLGKVSADGCLECPFHGWRFDGAGACTHVPLNPDAKRERLFATPLPVHEEGGLVWLHTAPGEEAPAPPLVPELLREARGVTRHGIVKPWATHWTRAMENMLDSPHLPFVHRRTIGIGMRKALRPDSRLDMHLEDTPHGWRLTWKLDDVRRNGGSLSFVGPNAMVLDIPLLPGKRWRMHAWCVPAEAGRTRMVVVGARDFLTWLPRLLEQGNRRILLEDQAVVESSQPPEVPPPSEEVSVATDRPTLRFRRYYYETLKGSRAEPLAPRRPRPVAAAGTAVAGTAVAGTAATGAA